MISEDKQFVAYNKIISFMHNTLNDTNLYIEKVFC